MSSLFSCRFNTPGRPSHYDPTEHRTGLGLSLSCDIITKEHNGSIKAESKEVKEVSLLLSYEYNVPLFLSQLRLNCIASFRKCYSLK